VSESETGTIDAEQKALEEIGIPRGVQEGIKTLVTGSSNAMERYDVAARAAADHVERVEPSDKACNRLLSALYLHAETVKLRETFTTSSTGLPALDEALKRGTAEDALEAENLKQDTSGPVASCLAKSLLPQR
jgi:hypothetical protein